jgi:hypothetical protein
MRIAPFDGRMYALRQRRRVATNQSKHVADIEFRRPK